MKRGRLKLSARMWITVRARQNTKEWNRRHGGVREMAYFEVAKCFEKELLWVLSLSKGEGKVIFQELIGWGRDWSIITMEKSRQ